MSEIALLVYWFIKFGALVLGINFTVQFVLSSTLDMKSLGTSRAWSIWYAFAATAMFTFAYLI